MTRSPLELLTDYDAAEQACMDAQTPADYHAADALRREATVGIVAALRAQAEACEDTTDYDNAVTETVCDRLLEVIAGQGEPSFGGPRLNMIVQLIRDLRAQAEANAGELEALRDEHEALRLAENGSHPQLRRLRGRIEELVHELEAHQLSAVRVASVRERVEEARRWAAAALAQADAGGEG